MISSSRLFRPIGITRPNNSASCGLSLFESGFSTAIVPGGSTNRAKSEQIFHRLTHGGIPAAKRHKHENQTAQPVSYRERP